MESASGYGIAVEALTQGERPSRAPPPTGLVAHSGRGAGRSFSRLPARRRMARGRAQPPGARGTSLHRRHLGSMNEVAFAAFVLRQAQHEDALFVASPNR